MKEKLFLNIFILCIIFPKDIVGTFLENDIDAGELSNLLVREKRVVNRMPGEDARVGNRDVPYVVNIRKNGFPHCVGTILSHRTVITAVRCAVLEVTEYSIFSGSTNVHFGQFHMVTGKKVHLSPSRSATLRIGIALLIVNPPFEYSSTVNKIELHTGPVFTSIYGAISGWGVQHHGRRCDTGNSTDLKSIIVPIMSHRNCVGIYRGVIEITDEDVCTYHLKKECGYTDAGAPFVINNELVGVHIGGIETGLRDFPIKPDVFAFVQHLNYGQWIRANIV